MKTLIEKYSDASLTTRKNIFLSLCKSIIGQQISVAAANSVFLKFKKKCNKKIWIKKLNFILFYLIKDKFLDLSYLESIL